MASAPYRIIDRRGSSTYWNSNSLIPAATQSSDRQSVPVLDFDIHRTVSSFGRRVLMSLGRSLFWRFPALMGAVLEQANLAVSTFIPQYTGRNKEWGNQAEEMLRNWHQVMDVAGWPYDYDSYVTSLVVSPLVEGENFTLLCETPEGYPMIQTIPAHRVGSKSGLNGTAKVRYEGKSLFVDGVEIDSTRPYETAQPIEFDARMVDGVVVDDYSRPIAYRVYRDNHDSGPHQDIAARNFFPAFCPLVTGQVRGFSLLASSAFNWQDVSEWKDFERIAQKAFSTKTIVETNETGEADSAKQIIKSRATFSDGSKTALDVQTLAGGTYTYLRANTGSKLESFDYNRPGINSQQFMETSLRDAFRGTEWDYFFSLDPSKLGGATMRIVVEKINTVAAKRRKLVRKCCLRTDGFAISKFMKLGLLPWADDWYMWEYQGPGDVSADKKYDSDVDIQEISSGISTRRDALARRGKYIEDVDAQRLAEADSDLSRAKTLADKYNIPLTVALTVLLRTGSYSSVTNATPQPEDNKQPTGNESEQ